jgi:hypothetical protein
MNDQAIRNSRLLACRVERSHPCNSKSAASSLFDREMALFVKTSGLK